MVYPPHYGSTPKKCLQIAINWDTTGSMYSCLEQVKSKIIEIIANMSRRYNGEIQFRLSANGDYQDARQTYVFKAMSAFTSDTQTCFRFVNDTGSTCGYDAPEAYEFALHKIRFYKDWNPAATKLLLFISDDIPHPKGFHLAPGKISWQHECQKLKELGVMIYPIQCQNSAYANMFYKQMAELTNGVRLRLAKFDELEGLLLGVAAQQQGTDAVEAYQLALEQQGKLTTSMKKILDQLVMKSINDACDTFGGKYAEYSCKTVSWDDVSRGTVGSKLSCWGKNITDTYLRAKDGRTLFTVRSDNWNEKLAIVNTKDVAIVQGNQNNQAELRPITLKKFLENANQYGRYAGLLTDSLAMNRHDNQFLERCSIRFQTTFIPVDNKEKATAEFTTEAYNYNTLSDSDPRNLILLCSTQGMALQQDGSGAKKVFHHSVDGTGKIHRHWLEAERSRHKVGGAQKETDEERADAIKRGKATASVIGIKAMGTRFNALMTVQIPLVNNTEMESFEAESDGEDVELEIDVWKAMGQQGGMAGFTFGGTAVKSASRRSPPPVPKAYGSGFSFGCVRELSAPDSYSRPDGCSFGAPPPPPVCNSSMGAASFGLGGGAAPRSGAPPPPPPGGGFSFGAPHCAPPPPPGAAPPSFGFSPTRLESKRSAAPKPTFSFGQKGTANAARVSKGTDAGIFNGLVKVDARRNTTEHITITVVNYYTIAGGVPTMADVKRAIDDIEELYEACGTVGNLKDEEFSSMKDELTVAQAMQIDAKVTRQPYKPVSVPVADFDVFPE